MFVVRRCLLPLVISLLAVSLHAQIPASVGVKIGYGSTLMERTYSQFDVKQQRLSALNVALFLETLDFSPFSLLAQVEYTHRGFREEFILTDASGPTPMGTLVVDHRVHYISVPLLAKLRLPLEPVVPYLLVGPRFDMKVGYTHDDVDPVGEMYKKLSSIVPGATFGAGLSLRAGLPASFLMEFRYNIDIKDSYQTDALKIRNNAYDVWLGVEF